MAEEQQPNVIICGGGPSGLLASTLLNNIGIKSTILERATEPDQWRSRSYTLVLSETGMNALDRGGCLGPAKEAGKVRSLVYIINGQTGEVKEIPQTTPKMGYSRPLLVECLENFVGGLSHATLKRGAGVSSVTNETELGLQIHLEDDTVISGTHVIGADGKWSNVRQSFPSLDLQSKMITCPSYGVHMMLPSTPEGWKDNGTYIIKPPEGSTFYIIGSPLPTSGFSVSMVCSDQTAEKYPWLAPPPDTKPEDSATLGWKDEYSAMPSGENSDSELPDRLEKLFREMVPALHAAIDKEAFQSARINRRVSWVEMSAADGENVTYSTEDGLVTLIGDAAHTMTPSMGQGCNCALESAVKLIDAVVLAMEKNEETVCTVDTLSEAFVQYGSSRPAEVQPMQEMSAARSNALPSLQQK